MRALLIAHPLRLLTLILAGLATACTTAIKPDPLTTSEPIPLAESAPLRAEPLASEPARQVTAQDKAISFESLARRDRAIGALGVRYRYGGTSPESGFDCSGLIRWIYQDIADQLPRSSLSLSQVAAQEIEAHQLVPGDLVFFRINRSRSISHVGMYMGDGQFIHAPSSGGQVRVESLAKPYWRARLVKATRLSARAPGSATGS